MQVYNPIPSTKRYLSFTIAAGSCISVDVEEISGISGMVFKFSTNPNILANDFIKISGLTGDWNTAVANKYLLVWSKSYINSYYYVTVLCNTTSFYGSFSSPQNVSFTVENRIFRVSNISVPNIQYNNEGELACIISDIDDIAGLRSGTIVELNGLEGDDAKYNGTKFHASIFCEEGVLAILLTDGGWYVNSSLTSTTNAYLSFPYGQMLPISGTALAPEVIVDYPTGGYLENTLRRMFIHVSSFFSWGHPTFYLFGVTNATTSAYASYSTKLLWNSSKIEFVASILSDPFYLYAQNGYVLYAKFDQIQRFVDATPIYGGDVVLAVYWSGENSENTDIIIRIISEHLTGSTGRADVGTILGAEPVALDTVIQNGTLIVNSDGTINSKNLPVAGFKI